MTKQLLSILVNKNKRTLYEQLLSLCLLQEGTEYGTVLLMIGNKLDLVDDETPQVISAKNGSRLAEVRIQFPYRKSMCWSIPYEWH